jgi:hypothetical protein
VPLRHRVALRHAGFGTSERKCGEIAGGQYRSPRENLVLCARLGSDPRRCRLVLSNADVDFILPVGPLSWEIDRREVGHPPAGTIGVGFVDVEVLSLSSLGGGDCPLGITIGVALSEPESPPPLPESLRPAVEMSDGGQSSFVGGHIFESSEPDPVSR